MKNFLWTISVNIVVMFFAGSSFADGKSEMLQKACASQDPVLVYDNFPSDMSKRAVVDLNGDEKPDVSHGEYVEKIVQISGHTTVTINLLGEVQLEDVEKNLAIIVDEIKSGKAKYSRINFSQEIPLKIAAFKKDLFEQDDSVPQITAQNIAQYREAILKKIWTERPDLNFAEIYNHFIELEKLGVPTVVAAGNNGPNYVNAFSLFPGVISVGSLDLDGTKRVLSADNALVTEWRVGSFVSEQLADGIDINQDGKTDFSNSVLSTGPKIVDRYVGQKVDQNLFHPTADLISWAKSVEGVSYVVANAALNALTLGLYRVSEIVELATVTPGTKRHFLKSGTLAFKSETGPPTFFFTESTDGKVKYDPLKTGSDKQVMMISGTSFAAPAICNKQSK